MKFAGVARLLPSLSRQEAIFVGEATAVPAIIIIRDLRKGQLPNSNDILFVVGWSQPPVDKGQIENIVNRWRKVNN